MKVALQFVVQGLVAYKPVGYKKACSAVRNLPNVINKNNNSTSALSFCCIFNVKFGNAVSHVSVVTDNVKWTPSTPTQKQPEKKYYN